MYPSLSLFIAINAETAMKITIKTLMTKTCFFSVIFFTMLSFIISSVNVELDAKTSEERVDIDADNTKTITTAIKIFGNPSSIVGIIASNPPEGAPFTTSNLSVKSLPY